MFGVRSGSPPKQGRSISLFLTTSPRSRRKCKISSIRAVSTLGQEYPVEKIELPNKYEDLLAAAKLVNDYEGSRSHEKRWREYGDRMGQKLSSLIARGLQISEAAWHESLQCLREASLAMEKIFAEIPFVLTPAALESAPEGFASTGDPAMNAVWTAMGTPAVGIPMPVAAGLPLGLQMIGARRYGGIFAERGSCRRTAATP